MRGILCAGRWCHWFSRSADAQPGTGSAMPLGHRTFRFEPDFCRGFSQRVKAMEAPQTIYSDHFLEQQPIDRALGFG